MREYRRGVDEGRADVGICWDVSDLRGLRSMPYRSDRLAVVIPSGHQRTEMPSLFANSNGNEDVPKYHLRSVLEL